MQKLKKYIKRTNGLAIFSFLLAIFALVYVVSPAACGDISSILSGAAVLIGIVALIWLKVKKQGGEILAILGIVLGIFGIILTPLCY